LFRFRRGAVHPRPGRGLHRGGPRAATGGTLGVRGDASDALDLPGRPGPGWSARHQFVFRPHPVCGDRRAGPGDVRGVSPHARRLHPCTARCRVRPGRSGRTGMAGGSRAGVGPVGPGAWRVVPRHRDLPLRAGHMSGPHSAEITATLADGRVVGGRVYRLVHGPQDLLSVWNARGVWDFAPASGDAGAAGMDAAVRALAGWLRREVPTTELSGDTAVQVTWPSHDVAVFPVLLAHGLVPTTVLATRPLGLSTLHRSTDVRVRKATMSDIDDVAKLAAEEMRFSAQVVGATPRDNADELIRINAERAVYFGGRVYLAELDGVAVGVAVCGVTDPADSPTLSRFLPAG